MPESRRRRSKKPSRARRTAPQGLPVQVRFGARYLDGILTSESSGQAKGESVEVALHATELHRDPPDMTAPMQLYTRVDGVAKDPRYGGYLTELEAGKDCWWIVRSNNLAHLGDHLTGGITTKRVPPIELLWSTMRGSGMPPERLHMHGWSPPRESIVVAMPVTGIEPIGELEAGQVGLTQDPRCRSCGSSIIH